MLRTADQGRTGRGGGRGGRRGGDPEAERQVAQYRSGVAALLAIALLGCATTQVVVIPTTEVGSRLLSDLSYLAGPGLKGRLTGTPGNDSAAAFIARRYAALGLRAAFKDPGCQAASPCSPSFFQYFRLGAAVLFRFDARISPQTQNVAGLLDGTDSALKREYVVVGAHYDHIGLSRTYSLDAGPLPMMHLGADDNASGTVAVLELARRFSAHPTRRPIVFANFGAEEFGLVGSKVFVDHSPIPVNDVITMVNLDMVGRLRGNYLIVFSDGGTDRFRQVVDSVERLTPPLDFRIAWKAVNSEGSDQISFAEAHVPVVSLFTGYHADYHRAGDVVSRINFDGLGTVVDLTGDKSH